MSVSLKLPFTEIEMKTIWYVARRKYLVHSDSTHLGNWFVACVCLAWLGACKWNAANTMIKHSSTNIIMIGENWDINIQLTKESNRFTRQFNCAIQYRDMLQDIRQSVRHVKNQYSNIYRARFRSLITIYKDLLCSNDCFDDGPWETAFHSADVLRNMRSLVAGTKMIRCDEIVCVFFIFIFDYNADNVNKCVKLIEMVDCMKLDAKSPAKYENGLFKCLSIPSNISIRLKMWNILIKWSA